MFDMALSLSRTPHGASLPSGQAHSAAPTHTESETEGETDKRSEVLIQTGTRLLLALAAWPLEDADTARRACRCVLSCCNLADW